MDGDKEFQKPHYFVPLLGFFVLPTRGGVLLNPCLQHVCERPLTFYRANGVFRVSRTSEGRPHVMTLFGMSSTGYCIWVLNGWNQFCLAADFFVLVTCYPGFI